MGGRGVGDRWWGGEMRGRGVLEGYETECCLWGGWGGRCGGGWWGGGGGGGVVFFFEQKTAYEIGL